MRYSFTIIAVDQRDYTPELVIDQHGTHGGSSVDDPPTLTTDRAEMLGEWLATKAPACFRADVPAIKRMVDDCLAATFRILRTKGIRRSNPQILIELKKAGVILWLNLETT